MFVHPLYNNNNNDVKPPRQASDSDNPRVGEAYNPLSIERAIAIGVCFLSSQPIASTPQEGYKHIDFNVPLFQPMFFEREWLDSFNNGRSFPNVSSRHRMSSVDVLTGSVRNTMCLLCTSDSLHGR